MFDCSTYPGWKMACLYRKKLRLNSEKRSGLLSGTCNAIYNWQILLMLFWFDYILSKASKDSVVKSVKWTVNPEPMFHHRQQCRRIYSRWQKLQLVFLHFRCLSCQRFLRMQLNQILLLVPKPRSLFCYSHTDGVGRFLSSTLVPNSYAVTGIRINRRFAPPQGTFL